MAHANDCSSKIFFRNQFQLNYFLEVKGNSLKSRFWRKLAIYLPPIDSYYQCMATYMYDNTKCNSFQPFFSGMLSVQSSLSLGADTNDVMKVNGDHVVANGQPIESGCWLSPLLVSMAIYILQTCPIHSRYVRRGRGLHEVKAAKEFFVTPSDTLVMECQEAEFVQKMLNAKNSPMYGGDDSS